jgi:hypothetical protein
MGRVGWVFVALTVACGVAILVLLQLNTPSQPAACTGLHPCSGDSGNPFNLPIQVLGVLFVISGVGTVFNAGRATWRFGSTVVRRMRKDTPAS